MESTPGVHAAAFPWERLAHDLKVRDVAPSTGAVRAGLLPCVVLPWVRGLSAPRARGLRRFLTANGIDTSPYKDYFAAVEPVAIVCPLCDKAGRSLRQGELRFAARRAKDRVGLIRREDGSYERPCRKCSASRVGRVALKKVNADRKSAALAMDCRIIDVDLDRKTRDRIKRKFRQQAQQPKSPQHRRAIGDAHRERGDLTRPFNLCLLCDLLVHGASWHKRCALQWLYWRRKNPGERALPAKGRGRPSDKHLNRDMRWLLWESKGTRTWAELVAESKQNGELGRYSGRSQPSRSTVTMALQRLAKHLPGSWDMVFPVGYKTRGKSVWAGQRAALRAQRSEVYQRLVPLPDKINASIAAGERNALIQRLSSVGMPLEWIGRLTGAMVHADRAVSPIGSVDGVRALAVPGMRAQRRSSAALLPEGV